MFKRCHASPLVILEDKQETIHSLSEELLCHIFSFLNYSEAQEIVLVNELWRQLILFVSTTEENIRIQYLASVIFGNQHAEPFLDVASFSEFRTIFFSSEYKIIEQIFESGLEIAEIDMKLKDIRKPIFFDVIFEFVKKYSINIEDLDAICVDDTQLLNALNPDRLSSIGSTLLLDFIAEYLIAISPKLAIRRMLCSSNYFFLRRCRVFSGVQRVF